MPPAPSLARLPGFRDFAPADLALRRRVFRAWRRACARHGFQEYDGPPLERLALYVEKSGDEIVEQLYGFTDKGGREVALRPEMTPTLARMLAERSRGMPKPIRWFSIPQLFRYERSQRGRLREHFQLNVDVVGEAGVGADAEVLAVAIDALGALGLTRRDFAARINDRRLVAAVLARLGVPTGAHRGCLEALDKAGRAGADATAARLAALGLDARAVSALADLTGEGARERVSALAEKSDDVRSALEPLDECRSVIEAMGLGDFVEFDFTVVRGLAYYTGIVFELFDRAGEFRAIAGGGRYDGLLERLGGESLPAAGFGMGDVVLSEILKDRGLAPDAPAACDCFVVWVSEDERADALALSQRLRERGRRVAHALRPLGVGKQLKAAGRAGAAHAVIVGPEETRRGSATVRDLETGRQETVSVESLLASGPELGARERGESGSEESR